MLLVQVRGAGFWSGHGTYLRFSVVVPLDGLSWLGEEVCGRPGSACASSLGAPFTPRAIATYSQAQG